MLSIRCLLGLGLQLFIPLIQANNVERIPNFLSDEETEHFRFLAPSASGRPSTPARKSSAIPVKSDVARRLQSVLQVQRTCIESTNAALFESSHQVMDVTTLSRTTTRHADTYRPVATPHQRYELEDDMMVAFVPLETNSNAIFRHGDEDVPIEKGTMLLFDGKIPHHTVISKNMVKMLGPFAFSKSHGFAFVGVLEECVPEDCESMQCCNMTECCPPGSTGACCFGDGSCSNSFTEEQCLEESNGSACFLGLGTSCDPAAPCDEECGPSEMPSQVPSDIPSDFPSFSPSDAPSATPSSTPSSVRSKRPTVLKPTKKPGKPTAKPSGKPSGKPSHSKPSWKPSSKPAGKPHLKKKHHHWRKQHYHWWP